MTAIEGREDFDPGVPGLPPGAFCSASPSKPPAEAGGLREYAVKCVVLSLGLHGLG
jgi:hypothetical protein